MKVQPAVRSTAVIVVLIFAGCSSGGHVTSGSGGGPSASGGRTGSGGAPGTGGTTGSGGTTGTGGKTEPDGGSGACPDVTACGGSAVGTWTVKSSCLTVKGN